MRLGGGALGAREERRPELDALGAERERGGDSAPVHDRARRDHGHAHAVDDLREQREASDHRLLERVQERPAMAAGLAALRDDEVDAGLLERDRLGRCRRSAREQGAGGANRLERRDPEGEAEERDALLGDHGQLRLEQRRRIERRADFGRRNAQLGVERRERVQQRRPVRLRLLDRAPREEVDPEGPVGELADPPDDRAQVVRLGPGATERPERPGVRHRGDELGRRRPDHGRLQDRIADAEQLGRPRGAPAHRGETTAASRSVAPRRLTWSSAAVGGAPDEAAQWRRSRTRAALRVATERAVPAPCLVR